jgi:hypothetical protein
MLNQGFEKPNASPTRVSDTGKGDARKRGRLCLGPLAIPQVSMSWTKAPVFELPPKVEAEYLRLCQEVDELQKHNAVAAQDESSLAKQLWELQARGVDVDRKLVRQHRRALELCDELQRASWHKTQVASEVALGSLGWKRARSKFSLAELLAGRRGTAGERYRSCAGFPSRLLDHQEFFLGRVIGSARPAGPSAVVAHLYRNDPETIVEEAARVGLLAQFLPDSCYFPGRTLSVVYTRP